MSDLNQISTIAESQPIIVYRCSCGNKFNVTGYPDGYKFACPNCHAFCIISTDQNELEPGTILGDFVIGRIIGRGGMGIVYLGQQLSLERPVAIKVLKPSVANNEKFIQRFTLEAKTAAQISHNNIVQIYYVGQKNKVFFIAMEYVDGQSVREIINGKRKTSEAFALDIILQASSGLQRAHQMNILHRDIKPDNLIVNRQGEVKVADFGLALDLYKAKGQTAPKKIEGSPHYMSPEQAMRGKITFASDIYSLGATLYHLATLSPPFTGSSPTAIIAKHVTDYPRSPRELNPSLSKNLCHITQKMMAKKIEERFSSMEEVINEIRLLRDDRKRSSVPSGDHWFIKEKDDATRLKEIMAVMEISKVFSQEKDLDKLLLRIIHEITLVMDAERSTLYIYDPDKEEIWAKVAEGLEKGTIIRLPLGKGVAGISARDTRTILINDAYNDARFNEEVDRQSGFRTRNMICMPVLGSEVELLGVIQVLNKKGGGFDHHDESLLSKLSVNVGLALEKSIFFCKTRPKCVHCM